MEKIKNTKKKQYQPVFILGCYRSGTTLVRNILNYHEKIAVTPETHFFDMLISNRKRYGDLKNADTFHLLKKSVLRKMEKYHKQKWGAHKHKGGSWEIVDIEKARRRFEKVYNLKELFIAVLELTASKKDYQILVEKTPMHTYFVKEVLSYFPDAKIINVVRDGREVCASASKKEWKADKYESAARWIMSLEYIDKCNFKDGNFLEIRYEELICNSREVLGEISEFIGLGFDERFFRNMDKLSGTSSFEDGRKGLYVSKNFEKYYQGRDKEIINYLLHRKLAEKGYETSEVKKYYLPWFKLKIVELKWRFYIFAKKVGHFGKYRKIKMIFSK